MHQQQQTARELHHARIVASVAATFMSLACGSNYVYSAWAPQFAERLHLSSTESNLIGLAGNLGMYLLGVPIGVVVDSRGARPAVLVGAVLLALGYFPLHQAYDRASGSVPALCFFSFLSGLGGCMAFSAAVKMSALNWPHSRGTATAFPLAAFGLSAFFFSMLGSLLFPGDPSGFLMLLSWGTSGMTFVAFFFMKVHPQSPTSYQAIPGSDRRASLSESQQLDRTSSEEPKSHRSGRATVEPGRSQSSASASTTDTTSPITYSSYNTYNTHNTHATSNDPPAPAPDPMAVPPGVLFEPESARVVAVVNPEDLEADETSSLLSGCSSQSGNDLLLGSTIDIDRSHRTDLRGLALMRTLEFWLLFSIMGILAGVGLMTINNIGNNVKALWKHYDPSVTEEFLVKRQQLHVSVLSVCSFLGRLLSGVGSDFLVLKLHASRVWCLVIACAVFFLAQICALNINEPHYLGLVSGLSGIAYGFLFGVYPSITAETFGIRGLSQNWGFMTLSPVISSNIFNLFYGKVYDQHSVVQPGGERVCLEGLDCYQTAYWVTLGGCVSGLAVILWAIRHQREQYVREHTNKGEEED